MVQGMGEKAAGPGRHKKPANKPVRKTTKKVMKKPAKKADKKADETKSKAPRKTLGEAKKKTTRRGGNR